MELFNAALDQAKKQSQLGFGLVALLTAGGEQVSSSAVFRCPCSDLNLPYGMVFLLVPALALLLLGFLLSKKTWKLLTGACRPGAPPCRWRRLAATGAALFSISGAALVAPVSWVSVALLNGRYYECAMAGTNVSAYAQHLCAGTSSPARCRQQLLSFPCRPESAEPLVDRDDVLLRLRAHSQILGWLLIASILLSKLLLTCSARCSSPISHLQLKFWRVYAQEESSLMDSYSTEHARKLVKRNLDCFFGQTLPEDIVTPSSEDWEKISSLYKFSTKDHFYSTLHQYAERCQETEHGMVKMGSVSSSDRVDETPSVLGFVEEDQMGL